MGITLSLDTSTGVEVPFWFYHTDSKLFYRQLYAAAWGDAPDDLRRLADHFHLDLTPLTTMAYGEQMSLADFLAEDPTADETAQRAEWHAIYGENESAWQPPALLVAACTSILHALTAQPQVFQSLGITEPYVTNGLLQQDMRDLRRAAEWAQVQGIPQVRLVAQ